MANSTYIFCLFDDFSTKNVESILIFYSTSIHMVPFYANNLIQHSHFKNSSTIYSIISNSSDRIYPNLSANRGIGSDLKYLSLNLRTP